jgi:iron complex transport system substrate-binding protein
MTTPLHTRLITATGSKDNMGRYIRYKMLSLPSVITMFYIFFTVCFIPLQANSASAEIKDAAGRVLSIEKPFTRIISLYSAHTENLCSLGASEQLVGISKSDDYPENILSKPRFSYREDPERFIAVRPDLVLIRPMIERSYPQFIKKLQQAGIRVISLQPNSVDEMFEYWRNLGILSGREKEAEAMIRSFTERVQSIQTKLKSKPQQLRPAVYFQSIHAKSKTFAPDSIGIFALEQAGGINIGADARQVRSTNIAYYGKEQLLSKGDEIDIFLAQVGRMNPVTVEQIRTEPGYKAIRAVRENNVYLIKEQLISRPTLRIAEGIEQLYDLFFNQFNILN